MTEVTAAQQDYRTWMERLTATHDAVAYTCTYRLRDRAAAAQVAVQVIGGLLGRPRVFRYSGLPYSGAIARLAEDRIAAASQGRLPGACSWAELAGALDQVPAAHQRVLVLTCVHGYDDERVAVELACSPDDAARLRQDTLEFFRSLAAAASPVLEPRRTDRSTAPPER